MKYWNFYTPLSFIASCVWSFAEKHKIKLGRLAPIIFGLMIQRKPNKSSSA